MPGSVFLMAVFLGFDPNTIILLFSIVDLTYSAFAPLGTSYRVINSFQLISGLEV